MFNWGEAEAAAATRHVELSRCLERPQLERLELLQGLRAARRPLRSRLAMALVRMGARLDPATLAAHDSDALAEGRLAGYLP
jgi:hypothetical protein